MTSFIQSVQDGMVFQTAGSNDRMVIDSAGHLLVSKTSADSGVAGFEARNTGETFAMHQEQHLFMLTEII